MNELTTAAVTSTARDLAGRAGYDPGFLGPAVAVPTLPGVKTALLPYTHFSVLMRPDKRLAAVTALMMDGKKLIDLARAGIPWRLDPRIPADQQTGEQVYARNDIDRGHLVRRASADGETPRQRQPRRTRTRSTTQTRPRKRRSSTRAPSSGWAWSPTSRRTPPTTAGKSLCSPDLSLVPRIRSTAAWTSR